MPRNGSGTYSLPQPPFVAGTTISSAAMNSDLSDIATALTGSLPRDGQAGMLGQFKAIDGSAPAPSISFTNDSLLGFYRAGTNQMGVAVNGSLVGIIGTTGFQNTGGIYIGVPVGIISPYAGSSAPTGWLFCNGASLLRASYPALFAVLSTTYGAADGTHFNVPDMRNFVPIGQDNMGGAGTRGLLTSTYFGTDPAVIANTGGSQATTLAAANLPNHTHALGGSTGGQSADHSHNISFGSVNAGYGAGGFSTVLTSGSSFSTGGTSNDHSHALPANTGNNNGGGNTPISRVAPGIIVPYIIFAGA